MLSTFAFKSNLRRYNEDEVEDEAEDAAEDARQAEIEAAISVQKTLANKGGKSSKKGGVLDNLDDPPEPEQAKSKKRSRNQGGNVGHDRYCSPRHRMLY